MPNLSTLTVTLSANSAKLVAAFNQSQRRARTWGSRMRGTLSVAGRAFGLLGTAAVGSLSALTQAGIKSADSLAKTSAKLGILPNDLAGLRFAAEQTGVDIRKLDLGLQRMVRRVAEAAQGTGEAQNALKELGIDAKALAQLSPDEQFKAVADAMEDVGSQSDRVRLGFKLFDSEGVSLINTLAAGSEGIEAFTKEAASLGLTLSSLQLKNIEEAADAQNRLGRAFSGLGRQLAATFAPAITSASNSIVSLISRVTESIPRLAGMASAIFGIRRAVDALTLTETRLELVEVFKEIDAQRGNIVELKRTLESPVRFSQGGILAEAGLEEAERRLADLQQRSAALQKRMKDLKELGEDPVPLEEFLPVEPINQAEAALKKLQATAQGLFESTRTPLEQATERLRQASELNAQGLLPGGADTLLRIFDQVAAEAGRVGASVKSALTLPISEGADESKNVLNQFGIQAARNIQTTFSGALKRGIQGDFADIGQSFKDLIADMTAQVLANKLLTSFFGLFKGQSGFVGDISRGFLGIDKRAMGGPFSGTRPVLVGEKGPELLFPNRSGTVAPNSALGGSNVVVNIQNAPPGTTTRERRQGGTRIVDVIFDPIMRDLAGNGPLSQAFAGKFGLSQAFRT